jgi:hypothetical protein
MSTVSWIFSRLSGAEVYVGAIWNSLIWERPDNYFFEEELKDEILMLVTILISHEKTHEIIDEIDPNIGVFQEKDLEPA